MNTIGMGHSVQNDALEELERHVDVLCVEELGEANHRCEPHRLAVGLDEGERVLPVGKVEEAVVLGWAIRFKVNVGSMPTSTLALAAASSVSMRLLANPAGRAARLTPLAAAVVASTLSTNSPFSKI